MFARRVLAFYLVLLLLSLVAILMRPMAFQKSAAITEDPQLPEATEESNALDVAAFLGSIEYTDQSVIVYDVHPRRKYERTIGKGLGNCSNLSFGAAYELRRQEIPYDIVFFLPKGAFLDGLGHSIVATRCSLADSTFDCLVDVLEAGLPMSGEHPATLAQVRRGAVPDFSILSLNRIDNRGSRFYGELLDRSTIGILQGEDIDRYFTFLERIYVPLGHRKLEKMLYDGIAVVLGLYPAIHVSSLEETFEGAEGVRALYLTVLWMLRFGFLVGLLWLPIAVIHLARHRVRRAVER